MLGKRPIKNSITRKTGSAIVKLTFLYDETD